MNRPAQALLALALGCSGCASETFTPDTAPEFRVIRDQAPLYRLGPQQAAPPEERLAKGDHLRLLRREFGYSFALLDDGQTGYIGNEDIEPAPPSPAPPPPEPERHSPRSPEVDLPPVEPPLPSPDLNAPPEDAPAL